MTPVIASAMVTLNPDLGLAELQAGRTLGANKSGQIKRPLIERAAWQETRRSWISKLTRSASYLASVSEEGVDWRTVAKRHLKWG